MTVKQFYLLALLGISLTGGFFLLIIWQRQRFRKENNPAPLFLSLAVFSWAVVAVLKFYDPPVPDLINVIKDRILSSFSNLFLLATVPYMPFIQKRWQNKHRVNYKKEQWVLGVFIFFSILTVVFTFIDRNITGDSGKKAIVVLDAFISLITMSVISVSIFFSLLLVWKGLIIRIYAVFFFAVLTASQLVLPTITLFPTHLEPYYHLTLVFMLTALSGFILVCVVLFSLLSSNATEGKKNAEGTFHIPIGVELGFYAAEKKYYLKLNFGDTTSKQAAFSEEIKANKLLQPFVNWVIYASAKKHNIKLNHSDMALYKYRMSGEVGFMEQIR